MTYFYACLRYLTNPQCLKFHYLPYLSEQEYLIQPYASANQNYLRSQNQSNQEAILLVSKFSIKSIGPRKSNLHVHSIPETINHKLLFVIYYLLILY